MCWLGTAPHMVGHMYGYNGALYIIVLNMMFPIKYVVPIFSGKNPCVSGNVYKYSYSRYNW